MIKRIIPFVLAVALVIGIQNNTSAQIFKKKKSEKKESYELKNLKDSVSYSMGADMGKRYKKNPVQVTPEAFMEGFLAGYNGADTIFSKEEIIMIKKGIRQILKEAKDSKSTKKDGKVTTTKTEKGKPRVSDVSAENRKKGQAFLAENAKKEGVIVMDNGLQYKIIKTGEGRTPSVQNEIVVNYKGMLIDGTVFDEGKKAKIPLKRVIKGWKEGITKMNVGSKYIFYIPADLAYGDRDKKPIPPGSTLIFEVELLEIKKAVKKKKKKN